MGDARTLDQGGEGLRGRGGAFGRAVDMDGRPVRRTKQSHPYSYDTFVLRRLLPNSEITGGAYTDRLFEWDHEKHDRLCQKHFGNRGQYWDQRKPAAIEAFLRDYLDRPGIRLGVILEGCNQASGYPVWYLGYADAPAAKNDATPPQPSLDPDREGSHG